MSIRESWRRLQLLLIIACGTCPAVLLLLDSVAPPLVKWGWVFPAVYVLLAFTGIRIKGSIRMAAGIGMSALFIAGSFFLAPASVRLGALGAAGLCSVLLIWSLKIGGWSNKDEIPVLWMAAGMILHFLGQLFLYVDRISENPELSTHSGVFLAALFGFCLLTMLSMNRKSLTEASGKRQSVPDIMRRRNTLMTIVLFVAAILTALLPSTLTGLSEVMRKIIIALVEFISNLIPDAPNKGGVQNEVSQLPPEIAAMGNDGGMQLNPIAEKIAVFMGAVISIAMTCFVLYRIVVILRDKIREMVVSLGKFAANVSEDYVDEITDTREDGTVEKIQRHRKAPRLSAREERNLPPVERIRYRYTRLLHRHPEWDAGSTAREKLPENLARLYEQARYSGQPVSEAEAAVFTDGTQRI